MSLVQYGDLDCTKMIDDSSEDILSTARGCTRGIVTNLKTTSDAEDSNPRQCYIRGSESHMLALKNAHTKTVPVGK